MVYSRCSFSMSLETKKNRRTIVGMDGKPTKIRAQNLPHTCLQCFPCSIHVFLAAQKYHRLLVKCVLHFPFRISSSKFPFRRSPAPSKSVPPCERRTVKFPSTRNSRNLKLLLGEREKKDLREWKGKNPSAPLNYET